jgi:hypothetical protein
VKHGRFVDLNETYPLRGRRLLIIASRATGKKGILGPLQEDHWQVCGAKRVGRGKRYRTLSQKTSDVLRGTPVFRGTCVPLQALLDYLESGQAIDEFPDDFPMFTVRLWSRRSKKAKSCRRATLNAGID